MSWLPFDLEGIDKKVGSWFGSATDKDSLFEHERETDSRTGEKKWGADIYNMIGRIGHGALTGAVEGGAVGTAAIPILGTLAGGIGGAIIGAGRGLYNDLTADSRAQERWESEKVGADKEKKDLAAASRAADAKYGKDSKESSEAYIKFTHAFDKAEAYTDRMRDVYNKGGWDDLGTAIDNKK